MRRRLPNRMFAVLFWGLAALFAATLSLWLLSYWCGFKYRFRDWQRARLEDRRWGVQSGCGRVIYWRHWYSWAELNPEAPLLEEPDVHESRWSWEPSPRSFFDGSTLPRPRSFGEALGFDFARSRSRTYEFDRVVIPYWSIAFCTGVLPGLWLLGYSRVRRQRKRRKLGLCEKCGYDLRASKDRCPECGTAIAGDTVKKAIA